MMKHASSFLLATVIAVASSAAVFAHEETYKGTVMTVAAAAVQVKVIADASKKETPMTFGVTPRTKVFRGDKAVSFADAHIQKDERIAVTINHDEAGHNATAIRLAAQK